MFEHCVNWFLKSNMTMARNNKPKRKSGSDVLPNSKVSTLPMTLPFSENMIKISIHFSFIVNIQIQNSEGNV